MVADALLLWAVRHGVTAAALDELRELTVTPPSRTGGKSEGSENRVASAVRLEASNRGDIVLWRNNVGALMDEQGRLVRYGLANESKHLNERIKSADLIGIYRWVIGPQDVGRVTGTFLSVETKREGWRYTGTPREIAQAAWATGVSAWGGHAIIHGSAIAPAFNQLAQGATR